MASNIHDDVRYLESEVARLQADNRSLELDNAQWRQRYEDAERLREAEATMNRKLIRDNTELATLMEGWVTNLTHGLAKYRDHLARRNQPDMNVRPSFLRRIEEDVDANGARPNQGEPRKDESDGSRMLRTSFNELDKTWPTKA